MIQLPDYDDLPPAPHGGRSAWGLWGPEDSVGLMNLITPEVSLAATRLPQTGQVIPLNAPLDFYDPPLWKRAPLQVDTHVSGWGMDEVLSGFNPQATSQWDALSHIAYTENVFYNGASPEDVVERGRNTIRHWAERGIVTRGVLLDLERVAADQGRPYSPGTAHSFTVADLEAARELAGVEYRPGDVIVLHTGFQSWYAGLDAAGREHISDRANMRVCGIEHSEDMARYLWNSHAAGVASDSPALEVIPSDQSPEARPFGMLHSMLIGQFGLAIGELWQVGDLAAACAADGRYEFLLASAPLNNRKGVGSTANALAVR